jgi:hypothetical protein
MGNNLLEYRINTIFLIKPQENALYLYKSCTKPMERKQWIEHCIFYVGLN